MSGDHAGSIFLSSSMSKDSFDSMNRQSSSCPTNILSAKAKIGLPLTDDEMRLVLRDRQKKDNHNMSKKNKKTKQKPSNYFSFNHHIFFSRTSSSI
jgi:hypothetical protein